MPGESGAGIALSDDGRSGYRTVFPRDQRSGNLTPNAHPAVHPGTYRIPADNPFVGATSFNGVAVTPAIVRSEFWAVGDWFIAGLGLLRWMSRTRAQAGRREG